MSDDPQTQCKRCRALLAESEIRRATVVEHAYCSTEMHPVAQGDVFCQFCFRVTELRGAVLQAQMALYYLVYDDLDKGEDDAVFCIDNALGFIESAFPQYQIIDREVRS